MYEHIRAGASLLCLVCLAVAFFLAGCGARKAAPALAPYREEGEEGGGALADAEGSPRPGPGEMADASFSQASAGASDDAPAARDPESSAQGPAQAGTEEAVTVHVCGAVRTEGVYTLAAGSRVLDAIEAAGGFREDADTAYLNLAMQVCDAWQIRVPTKEESAALGRDGGGAGSICGEGFTGTSLPGEDDLSGDGKVDLNTASREELMAIPGIGASKASRILDYREKNGRFETIEDLMNVSGIGKTSFEKMRAYIKVTQSGGMRTDL